MNFSVLMSVYHKEQAEYLRQALDSVFAQTLKANEVVLVEDGPLTKELDEVIEEYQQKYSELKVIKLAKNGGLGKALNEGLKHCSFDVVARMDTDDICVPGRFEKQIKYMEIHPEVDIVGGQITEFIGAPDNIVSYRRVPLDNDSIYKYMKSRCALNHVTVMFKKSAVLKAGKYQDWFWNEDYYLWIRMMINKCKFANMDIILVNVRIDKNMYRRRGGMKYFKSEKRLQQYMYKNHIIGGGILV